MRRSLSRAVSSFCAAALIFSILPLQAAAKTDQTIQPLETPPAIDGVLSENEWGPAAMTLPNYDLSTIPGEATEQPTLGGTVYLRYDEEHFYLAVQAVYDTHENFERDYDLWRGDALQIQISAPGRSDRRSFGFALNGDDGISRAYQSGDHRETYACAETGGAFFILRDEAVRTTTYEIALPLSWFSTASALNPGDEVAFSFAIHMHNGFYYEWAGGIVTEKDIGRAALLTLGGEKTPDPDPEPEPDPKPAETIELLLGDADRNNKINTTDARLVLQKAVGKLELEEYAAIAADVNADGVVNTTDARLILQYAVSKIDTFPAGDRVIITLPEPDPEPDPDPDPEPEPEPEPDPEPKPDPEPDPKPDPDPTGHTILPSAKEAGSPFSDLSKVENVGTSVLPDTKQIGYFVFTTADNAGLPFNIACHIDREKNRITALLPAGLDLSALVPTVSYYGDKLLAGEAEVASGQSVLDLRQDMELTMLAKDGSTQAVTVHLETLDTGLPSFAMTTADYQEIKSKEEYMAASFYVGGGDADVCYYAAESAQLVPGQAKGRGNTSWGAEKKGYTVKLEKKAAFLDMPKSKNWSLIANYEDKTLLRNYLAEYIGEQIGMEFVMQVRPVDLWYNGEYWGTYNLTEKVEIEKERVNITDYDSELPADQQGPSQVGYLLEFDSHVNEVSEERRAQWQSFGPAFYDAVSGELFFQIDIGGKWITIKKPSYKYLTEAHVQYIYDKVFEATAALHKRDYAAVSRVLDVQSFVQWYLVEEFMNNTDSSMHSSVYMTLDVGGKFKLGPVWDFDRSSGNCDYWNPENAPDSLYHSGAGWFRYLFEMEEGRDILRSEWARFKKQVADLDTQIEGWADMIYRSQQLNFQRWDILGRKVGANPDSVVNARTFEAQVKLLKDFLNVRLLRMDSFYRTIG